MTELDKRFTVVGGGKMGEAIVAGWLASTAEPAAGIAACDITVVEPGDQRRAFLEGAHGIACVRSVDDLAQMPDIVVLAVKPQVMRDVLGQVSSCKVISGAEKAPLFVSIAAGMPTSTIEAGLAAGTAVVRVMPNMPLSIGAGASGVCGGACATPEQVKLVSRLFGCLGASVIVDESQMDVVCALSGSGPAYVAALVEAMRDAAIAQGLDAPLAESLALQTVLGTARLMDETGSAPGDTRESICSPGGTTLAALDVLYASGFVEMFGAAIDAAVKRSKELAQC